MIDLTEAAIVRRIFEAFDRGASPREIAEGLNSDGEQAPYDGRGYQKLAGRGWPHTTVRSVLRNERYIGRVTWNRRQWNRSGDRKRRLSRLRPADDWVTAERSELVIIGPELWTRVQARLAERSRMTGVPKRRKGYFTSALSGLLRCGTCGSRMSLYGAVQKAGKTYRNFACSANREKGSEICPNSQQISEKKALGALVATVRGSLASSPWFRVMRRTPAAATPRGAADPTSPSPTQAQGDRCLIAAPPAGAPGQGPRTAPGEHP